MIVKMEYFQTSRIRFCKFTLPHNSTTMSRSKGTLFQFEHTTGTTTSATPSNHQIRGARTINAKASNDTSDEHLFTVIGKAMVAGAVAPETGLYA
jgi:hypothetical protein